jgi:hypothetical protein
MFVLLHSKCIANGAWQKVCLLALLLFLQASQDAPSSLNGVHSAMQELVKQACNAAGTALYHLRVQVSGTWCW